MSTDDSDDNSANGTKSVRDDTTNTEKLIFCEADTEVLSVLQSYCPKEYLLGITNKLNRSLSKSEFQKVLSFIRTVEKILQAKHLKRKPLTNFLLTNTTLYNSEFGESTEQAINFSLEDFDNDFKIKINPFSEKDQEKKPNMHTTNGNTSNSITNFTVSDAQKISHDKAAKYVRVDFSGGKNCKTLLSTFLKQCENTIKLCKKDDLNLLYLNLTTRITDEAQVMLEDLNYDNWDDIVSALKNKYGEPETFSQRLYNFLTTAKIRSHETTAEFGERISHLLSRTVESLADEPTIRDGSVSEFLRHLGKIFFVEQGNQNIAQYLRLYCKDYSADLSKLIREGSLEEQKLKGYGNNNRKNEPKNYANSTVSSTRSIHANNPNNNRKNSKTGKWCYWHANDSHDTKDCRTAPTCDKCKFKGHVANDCRTKAKLRKIEATRPTTDKKSKPPTRPCRICEKTGHYDSDCPDLKAFRNFQSKSSNLSNFESDDGPEFTNVRMVKAKTTVVRSFQTKPSNKDVFVKLEAPLWKKSFLVQLDGGAHVSIIKKNKLPPNTKISTKEILSFSGVDSPIEKQKSLGYTYLPIKMNNKTVDIKFHVIEDDSLNIDKDGILGGLFFDAAGVRIYYDLKVAKFMAFNTTFQLIYPDTIPGQTKKVMVLKCSNLSKNSDGLFESNQLPENLIAVDSLVRVNSDGKFPMMLSNISNEPIDVSRLSFSIEPITEKIETKIMRISSSSKICWKKRDPYPLNPRRECLLNSIRIDHLVLLTSPDLLPLNRCFADIQPTIKNKGEVERCTLKHKVIYIVFYRDRKSDLFNPSEFRNILETLKNILLKFHETNVGFLDDFNSVSKFQLRILERQISEILEPIKCSWVTLGKVPVNKHDFIRRQHEHVLVDHAGRDKMYEHIINKGYYWIGLKRDIQEVLSTCNYCQTYKKDNQVRRLPMQISDVANGPFEKIAIDVVIMKKEKTKRGNCYIITIQDNLTKFLALYPVATHTTINIFKCLIQFICQYDLPKVILSDNGTEFNNELLSLFMDTLGISQIKTSPYHPEGNGALERAHGKMKEYLQLYVTVEKRGEWDECLPLAASAYNKSKHATTGYSPHELVFGKKPNLPTETEDLNLTYEEMLYKLQDKLRFLHECAQNNIKKAKEASKARYDTKSRLPYIKEGDLISVKRKNRKKLENRYDGPYEVVSTNDTGVTVLKGQEMKRHHFQNIKPYFALSNSIITILVLIFLFLSAVNANEFVSPIQPKSPGILFQPYGYVSNKVDDWSIT